MANKNKIVYGDRVFEGNKIKSGNLHIATSLLSSSLEANTLSVVIETEDRTITEFERNAPIVYFYDGVQTGVFYVKSIDRNGPNTYKISATSAIGLLSENQHYGGIYSGETASELLASICGTIPYEIKTNLADIKLYGWLPIATARDNLSQVLFAIGATIRTDLNGVLRIAALWDGISGNLGLDRMYQGPSVTNAAKVTQVIVTEHQYIKSGESSTLFEGATEAGSIITFEEPVFNLSASGFTILESGANYAKLSSGSGRLTGTKYTHNKSQIIRDVVSAKEPNVKKVENATLVSLINSAAVADRMKNYYKHAQSIQAPVVYKGESTGNRVLTWDPYNKEPVTACIEIEDINISNTLKSTSKMLVGYKPPQTEDVEILENRIVLSGSGTWQIPDQAVNVRVVVIGAGNGGQAGMDGEPGDDGASASASNGGTGIGVFGKGGSGGNGGHGGGGGKFLTVDLEIGDDRTLQFQCGAGGTGGIANGAEGSIGTETTISIGGMVYSSGDGDSTGAGYTDIITKETYAKTGDIGADGANGGNGGESTAYELLKGDSGENSGDIPGGAGGEAGSYSGGSTPHSWREVDGGSSSASFTIGETISGYTKSSFDTKTGEWRLSDFKSATIKATGTSPNYFCTLVGSGSSQYRIEELVGNNYTENPKDVPGYRYKTNKSPNYGIAWQKGYGGGGGGGSSYNSPGGQGGINDQNPSSYGSGGNGASGDSKSIATLYGCGGDGGNGGGGGGGGGGSRIQLWETYTKYTTADGSSGGHGGKGGAGGDGADGCVIVYYGAPKKKVSGPVKDRNGLVVLDKLGRRLIV